MYRRSMLCSREWAKSSSDNWGRGLTLSKCATTFSALNPRWLRSARMSESSSNIPLVEREMTPSSTPIRRSVPLVPIARWMLGMPCPRATLASCSMACAPLGANRNRSEKPLDKLMMVASLSVSRSQAFRLSASANAARFVSNERTGRRRRASRRRRCCESVSRKSDCLTFANRSPPCSSPIRVRMS